VQKAQVSPSTVDAEGITRTEITTSEDDVTNMSALAKEETTLSIVRAALPQMSQHGISITPPNYAVWYEYLSGGNSQLTEELEQLLKAGQVSVRVIEDLYERYLHFGDTESLDHAQTLMNALLSAFREKVDDSSGQISNYGKALVGFSEHISQDVNPEDLSTFIADLVRETDTMVEQSNSLQEQFAAASSEISRLQTELESAREQAATDPLTGLCNRRSFVEQFDRVCAEALESGTHTPCLLILDIDHFKRVNDTHGHLAGDRVIQHIGTTVKRNIKGRDVVARLGGEEFAVLLTDAPFSGASAVAEQLRDAISAQDVELPGGDGSISVTVSLGVGWLRTDETFEKLIDRTDKALYKSKEGGRDRVTIDR
jgi:diguanylate cyclase